MWSVRVSCHTIAWLSGSPVRRSHTTVVSRWFATPTAARSPAPSPHVRSASVTTCWVLAQISAASCSTRPGAGMIWRCSVWARPTSRPSWPKTMHRVLVVPWSIAATKSAMEQTLDSRLPCRRR
jgi:hypothetical protein